MPSLERLDPIVHVLEALLQVEVLIRASTMGFNESLRLIALDGA